MRARLSRCQSDTGLGVHSSPRATGLGRMDRLRKGFVVWGSEGPEGLCRTLARQRGLKGASRRDHRGSLEDATKGMLWVVEMERDALPGAACRWGVGPPLLVRASSGTTPGALCAAVVDDCLGGGGRLGCKWLRGDRRCDDRLRGGCVLSGGRRRDDELKAAGWTRFTTDCPTSCGQRHGHG
jgi:hypothetical protein